MSIRTVTLTGRRRAAIGVVICATIAAALSVAALTPVANSADQSSVNTTIAGPVSFADVVAKVSPAVVNIVVEKQGVALPTRLPGIPGRGTPFDDFFGRFFDMPRDAPAMRSQALGSGFVIDPDGYIVTNHHVIDGADSVKVRFADGNELDADIVGRDAKTDLALLKVTSHDPLPFVQFGDSDAARVGEWVLAIGNPFGLGGSATAGIISARGRDIQSGPYDDYLQIDAPINSGNSGGPVFNGAGDVIGINTAIYSPNGGNIGIGFAIPARQAIQVIAALRENGTVTRGWLGVQIQDIDADLARALGAEHGALIADVVTDSPASRAGLQQGDLITRFNGTEVDDAKHLSRLVAAVKPGTSADVVVLRDGREHRIDVKLANVDTDVELANQPQDGTVQPGGLSLLPLNEARRAQLGVPDDATGVLVGDVQVGSKAADKGVRPGDVIVAVNRKAVDTVAEVVSELHNAEAHKDAALLLLRRGDAQLYVALSFS